MGDYEGGAVSRVLAWASHPFKSDMSAVDWLLFAGLIIVAIVLWTRVLKHITD